MQEHFKLRHVHSITGTFVLVVALLLVAAVVWTGRSQRWFKSNVELRIILPETGAAGIRQGSEVYFLGTLVGAVSDVVVDSTGRMAAEVKIRRDFFRFVRVDSSAVVKQKFGVAGDSFFDITRGQGRPLSERGASIVCNDQFQSALEAAIEEIRRETLQVLKKTSTGLDTWTKLGADLGETQQHLNQLAIRLENMAAGLEAGNGTLGKLITETDLADEAQNLLVGANERMNQLESAETNLDVAMKNLEKAMRHLPEISDSVARGTKELPVVLQQTKASMRELERLVEAMQRHWLLRKYVNKTNPPPVPPLSEKADRKPVKDPLLPKN